MEEARLAREAEEAEAARQRARQERADAIRRRRYQEEADARERAWQIQQAVDDQRHLAFSFALRAGLLSYQYGFFAQEYYFSGSLLFRLEGEFVLARSNDVERLVTLDLQADARAGLSFSPLGGQFEGNLEARLRVWRIGLGVYTGLALATIERTGSARAEMGGGLFGLSLSVADFGVHSSRDGYYSVLMRWAAPVGLSEPGPGNFELTGTFTLGILWTAYVKYYEWWGPFTNFVEAGAGIGYLF